MQSGKMKSSISNLPNSVLKVRACQPGAGDWFHSNHQRGSDSEEILGEMQFSRETFTRLDIQSRHKNINPKEIGCDYTLFDENLD